MEKLWRGQVSLQQPARGTALTGTSLRQRAQERAALEALVQRIDEEERGLTRAAAATERTKRQEAAHAAVAEPAGGAVLSAKKRLVVQLYIQRPLTLDGFKFDIRLYVLVTSIRPLKVCVLCCAVCLVCGRVPASLVPPFSAKLIEQCSEGVGKQATEDAL
jgi:hypothetical protein